MGIFERFLLENMQYSSFGSILREAIKTTKLRVVAGIQNRNPSFFSGHPATRICLGCRHESQQQPLTFSCHIPSDNKKKTRVVAMSHGDDPQFFLVAVFWQQEKG